MICFLYDGNGNVGQLADGTVAAHYRYDAFGNVVDSYGAAAGGNAFRFSTKYADDGTGLVYYGFRYYSAELGRWVSRDPIEESGGLNLYQFVSNIPNNSADALGLFEMLMDISNPMKSGLWKAEAGDTDLGDLAAKFGASRDDWQCIWPVKMQRPAQYSTGRVSPCDVFDVSNLLPSWLPGSGSQYKTLKIGISAYDHARYESTFGSLEYVQADNVPEKLRDVSGEGATPISRLLIAGHGSVSGKTKYHNPLFTEPITWHDYSLQDILILSQPPSFNRAKNRKGPVRCWFSRDADAVFYGCSSEKIAERFAKRILRQGAVSWGTNQTTTTWNGYIGWNRNRRYGVYHSISKSWDLENLPAVWKSFSGQL